MPRPEGTDGGNTRGLPSSPRASFAYAKQRAALPSPPGGWSWGPCPGSGSAWLSGCFGGRNERRCFLPPAEEEGSVVCWVLAEIHIPKMRCCLPRIGVWGIRLLWQGGRERGTGTAFPPGLFHPGLWVPPPGAWAPRSHPLHPVPSTPAKGPGVCVPPPHRCSTHTSSLSGGGGCCGICSYLSAPRSPPQG